MKYEMLKGVGNTRIIKDLRGNLIGQCLALVTELRYLESIHIEHTSEIAIAM